MAEKGQRAITKLFPRLSSGARHEACKVTSDLLEDLDRNIVRAVKLQDYAQVARLGNEGNWLKVMRGNCRIGGN